MPTWRPSTDPVAVFAVRVRRSGDQGLAGRLLRLLSVPLLLERPADLLGGVLLRCLLGHCRLLFSPLTLMRRGRTAWRGWRSSRGLRRRRSDVPAGRARDRRRPNDTMAAGSEGYVNAVPRSPRRLGRRGSDAAPVAVTTTSWGARGALMRTIGAVVTRLPPIDLEQVEAFWSRATESGAVATGSPLVSRSEVRSKAPRRGASARRSP
jgi:hypothetical protein